MSGAVSGQTLDCQNATEGPSPGQLDQRQIQRLAGKSANLPFQVKDMHGLNPRSPKKIRQSHRRIQGDLERAKSIDLLLKSLIPFTPDQRTAEACIRGDEV